MLISSLIYLCFFYLLNQYQKRKRVNIDNDELIVNFKKSNLVFDHAEREGKRLLKKNLNSDNEEE